MFGNTVVTALPYRQGILMLTWPELVYSMAAWTGSLFPTTAVISCAGSVNGTYESRVDLKLYRCTKRIFREQIIFTWNYAYLSHAFVFSWTRGRVYVPVILCNHENYEWWRIYHNNNLCVCVCVYPWAHHLNFIWTPNRLQMTSMVDWSWQIYAMDVLSSALGKIWYVCVRNCYRVQ